MSCWVVPSVAAEMWGVPVDAVLSKAQSGQVPTKSESGFLFIDVAPNSPSCAPPRHLRPPSPPTYVVISGDDPVAPANDGGAGTIALDDHLMPPIPAGDWRAGRMYSARARRAPAPVR
jgi:hypothetical protein